MKKFLCIAIALVLCFGISVSNAETVEFSYQGLTKGVKGISAKARKKDSEQRFYVTQTNIIPYTSYYGVRDENDLNTNYANTLTMPASHSTTSPKSSSYKKTATAGNYYMLAAQLDSSVWSDDWYDLDGRWTP